jgi:hypothetical protein
VLITMCMHCTLLAWAVSGLVAMLDKAGCDFWQELLGAPQIVQHNGTVSMAWRSFKSAAMSHKLVRLGGGWSGLRGLRYLLHLFLGLPPNAES